MRAVSRGVFCLPGVVGMLGISPALGSLLLWVSVVCECGDLGMRPFLGKLGGTSHHDWDGSAGWVCSVCRHCVAATGCSNWLKSADSTLQLVLPTLLGTLLTHVLYRQRGCIESGGLLS